MAQRKLALVGMMASGKTSLGQALATRLGVPFVDSDHEMIEASGLSVAEYFARHGEDAFRQMERETVAALVSRPGGLVLSLGGGAYMQPPVREILGRGATSVFLRVGHGELVRRLERGGVARRPLLASAPDWRARVAELLAEREPAYLGADVVFNAEGGSAEELAAKLADLLARETGVEHA